MGLCSHGESSQDYVSRPMQLLEEKLIRILDNLSRICLIREPIGTQDKKLLKAFQALIG